MRFRLLRLRFRRRLHQQEKRAEDLSQQAAVGIERYFFRRFGRLHKVRRLVLTWLSLMLIAILATSGQAYLLSGYFQTLKPVPGGIYNEGVLGTFSTANPIYAESDIDTTVSHLIFASLFTYNAHNQLVGELAKSYSVNTDGNVYTVYLKPHLTWQDGKPLTSSDVVFTYNLIENPDADSPFFNSWQNVSVSSYGSNIVVFKLPDALSSFPEDLTGGILPEHLLNNIPAGEMRSAAFNTSNPIGSGPFSWEDISVNGNDPTNAEEQIELTPFSGYVQGKPKLDEIVVHGYANQDELTKAFEAGQLNGAEGLVDVPSSVNKMKNAQIHNFILTAGVYVFLKTTAGVLANQPVRNALIQSVNVPSIMSTLDYPTREVNEPLLQGQLGYNPQYRQPAYNPSQAASILNQNGWNIGLGGIRTKSNQPLSFNLTVSNSPEYLSVAKQLRAYWFKLGVSVNIVPEDTSDFSNALQSHNYDAILYGISIGVDPDVFVYWDSSQAQANSPSRLNLSEWQNASADESLQEGRTRLSPALRSIDYQGFLAAWQQDNPALGLYQPRLLYITNGPVFGLNGSTLNVNTDRFNDVSNWEIDEARVTN